MAIDEGEEGSSQSQRRSVPPVRIRSGPDPFLVICRCFSVVTALTAILCVIVNVLSAVRSFQHRSDIFGGIFRCYATVIALFVAIAETEWGFILKFCTVLEYWVARGMLQIFYIMYFFECLDVLCFASTFNQMQELEQRRAELEALLVAERA
ncbi:hypothetical protein ACLOJK_038805 [Asimina triloba]